MSTKTKKDLWAINVHAGHNPDGKSGSGAVGLIKESTEARKVKKQVIKYLKLTGFKVYDCTVDNGKNQVDVLEKIIKKCNAHKVNLDVAIHFNVGRNDLKGDGKTGGIEVLVYNETLGPMKSAKDVCKAVKSLGFTNRGVKSRPELMFLNSTVAPAMLVECCFVDDADDVKLYNYKKMGRAIAQGIINSFCPYQVKTTKEGVIERNKPSKKYTKKGTLKKGTTSIIDKVQIVDGTRYGYRKKKKTWIRMKHTKPY